MKITTILTSVLLLIAFNAYYQLVNGQANTTLSNLKSPTAVNQDLLPQNDNNKNIGSVSKSWKDIYADGKFYLDGSPFLDNTGKGNIFIGNSGNISDTGVHNTVIGYKALYSNSSGSYNTATGNNTLYSNTTGYYNTATGDNTLFSNTTGYYNTANGYSALANTTTGNANTATGVFALLNNTTGVHNTATGYSALLDNAGDFNTATGGYSLYSNSEGSYNTATGDNTLFSNSTGYYNTANGYNALYSNSTGTYNTGQGYSALYFNTTGSYNTALGVFSGSDYGYSNTSALGYYAVPTASNQVRLGNSSVTSIGGYVSWSNISDGRYKKNVIENIPGLTFINKLKPVSYTLDVEAIDAALHPADQLHKGQTAEALKPTAEEVAAKQAKAQIHYSGFIAQDVEQAAKEVNYDFSGVDAPKNEKDMYGLRYAEFVVPLVKAVQEMSALNDTKEEKINAQQMEIDELKTRLSKVESLINSEMSDGVVKISMSDAFLPPMLGQNIPNPFDNSTIIPFRIPENCQSASLIIYESVTGKTVTAIPISCKETHLVIEAGNLASGTYTYSLFVDGKVIDTKQMVLTKY